MYSLGEKGAIRKYNRAKSSALRERKFKEKLGPQRNKRNSDLRARPHPDKLLPCKKGIKEKLKH